MTFATLGFAFATWYQTRKKKQKKYVSTKSGDWVVAMQVGRPVVEAIKPHFKKIDVLVDAQIILGSPILESNEDYKNLVSAVYKAMAQGQNKRVHLFLQGPLLLAHSIGQLAGLHNFDLTVYHFDITEKGFKAGPRVDQTWM